MRTMRTLPKISECAKNYDVKQSARSALCRKFSLETLNVSENNSNRCTDV